MSRFRRKGGLLLYDGKELSQGLPIRDIWPAEELVYPVSETEEAPAGLLVKEGDAVLAGQLLARGEGTFPLPVYASVSGSVKALEPRRTERGIRAYSVIVENDGNYREAERTQDKPLAELSREEILERVRLAGLQEPGGRTAAEKLTVSAPERIRYVIGNGLECEPYLTADYRRMVEYPERILDGLRAVLRLFPEAEGVMAVDRHDKDVARALREAIEPGEHLRIFPLKTWYPLGMEHVLSYRITGERLLRSAAAEETGCIVLGCDLLESICQVVCENRLPLHRVVTVSGDAVAIPQNFRVYIGTSYRELIGHAGGFRREPEKLIAGGPMTGYAMENLEVPVSGTSGALICMAKRREMSYEPGPCIRCGKCAEVCPEGLLPGKLADLAGKADDEVFERLGGMECCGCGCCSYICPAGRNLTLEIEAMCRLIREKRQTR